MGTLNMKFLVVLALAGLAMAEPEAAPQYPIRYGYSPQNYLGYGLHHSPVYNFPVVQKTVVKNAVAKPVVYTSSVNTLASPLLSSLYPKVFRTLNTPLVNTFGGLKTLTPAVVSPIAKREAEPEADPEADPQITTGLHYPVVYNTALHSKV